MAQQRSMSQDSTKKTVFRTNLDAKLSIGSLQQSYDVRALGTRAVIQHTLRDLRGNAMPAASTGHIHHMFGSSPCEHKTPKSSIAQPAGLEENGECPASVDCNNHQKTRSNDAPPPGLKANSTDSESAADANAAKPERHDANHSSAIAVRGSGDSRKRCSAGQPAAQPTTSITKPDDNEAMKQFTSSDAAAPSEGETSKTENGQGCESSLPEPRSAGQPPSLHDHVPTFLRNTALGTVLLDRMIWESWQPIMVDDIPWKWWPYFEKQDNSWTAGRPIALTMPDQPAFMIYKRWFEGLPPTEKLGIATFVESTQSFIEAYGADTYRRTLINLATHGKPQAIFVEVRAVSGTSM